MKAVGEGADGTFKFFLFQSQGIHTAWEFLTVSLDPQGSGDYMGVLVRWVT